MSEEQLQPGAHPERLDADAVCIQCGSVNPEGTLLCKICGNNLRDQRQMRFASDHALEGREAEPQSRWLLSALAVLGLLLVLWTMINIGNIENWLVRAQVSSATANDDLWYGAANDEFESLLTEIRTARFSPGNIPDFMAANTGEQPLDGVYVVVRRTPYGIGHLATAGIRTVDDDLYFAAELRDGGEVRGIARNTGSSYAVNWGDAAALYDGQYWSVAGVAIRQQDGSFESFGQVASSDASYEFLAYRLPEESTPPAP